MLPCSMTRSLPSSDFSAAGKNSLSTTFLVPCSITSTSSSSALTSSSPPIWPTSFAQKSGRFMVVMPTVTVPGSARSAGTSATQLAPSMTTSASPATTSNQYQPPSTNGVSDRSNSKWLAPFVGGGRRVDPLRAAVGHRAVDGDRRAGAAHGDVEGDLLDDRPAAPVAGREAVEVGAGGDALAVVDPEAVAVEDRVGVQRGAGRDRLAQGRPVEVLGGPARADRLLVGVEHGRLGVDVQRDDVEVAVGGQHEALQHLADGLHAAGGAGRVGGQSVVIRRLLRTSARRRPRSAA